ncbi:hypothetical protein GALMADRAFT_237710 [Galerina marginata CBS 339.88]|uniref:F-box domain-containing protein n=1 Tax=Galerina marginata (strain CBS 339.88) TaxID=685588 RepID=A0A067TJA6_GALM3|nr:hypothetical protein GALMADRAFT_237710 [Galerina marginata CBS 339.88]
MFPTEIYDIIVGFLAEEEDMDSMKAVALSHSAVLPSCRSHIFATLNLISPAAENGFSVKLESIKKIFVNNPDLAFYVRILYYEIQVVDHRSQPFHTILKTFSRVKTLTILGITAGYRLDTNWRRMAASLRAGLTSIVTSPSLEKLHLHHVEAFPIKTLVACPNLSHLTLKMSQFDKDELISQDESPVSALRLLSLAFGSYSSPNLQTLMDAKGPNGSIIDFSHLVSLTYVEPSHRGALDSLLVQSRSLESLSTSALWHSGLTPTLCDAFVSLKGHNLKTLKTFETTIYVTGWIGLPALDPLFSLADKFPADNTLERIEIKIIFDEHNLPPSQWPSNYMTKLNDFAIKHQFPALREVSLSMTLPKHQEWAPRFKSTLEKNRVQAFESLIETERIAFHFAIKMEEKGEHFNSLLNLHSNINSYPAP